MLGLHDVSFGLFWLGLLFYSLVFASCCSVCAWCMPMCSATELQVNDKQVACLLSLWDASWLVSTPCSGCLLGCLLGWFT